MVFDPERGCVRGATISSEPSPKELKKMVRKIKKEVGFTSVKDSGERQEFPTGAKRDIQTGKGLPHLLPTHALKRLAQHFENGAKKYGENNWRLGIPLSRYLDSAFRHWCDTVDCLKDEDHPCGVLWNMACFMETAYMISQGRLPKELDDIGWFNDEVKPTEIVDE